MNENALADNVFTRYYVPVPRKIHLTHSLSIAIALLKKTDMVSVFPWPLVEVSAAKEGLCAIPLREHWMTQWSASSRAAVIPRVPRQSAL